MSEIAIRLENISKQYTIGSGARYKALRDTFSDALKFPVRALRRKGGNGRHEHRTIWALRDVSCEIKRGDVVGVIGRNGAGKSTMLKILSRITEPTSGMAEIHGRVGSLLEVGSGFHNELTGRENTFLNGAILGMTRAEITRKFDEIVAFAEIEKFIDTPVKFYSTGMHMRLAFAVAAHLEPEILLVDEVLAVGDARFQKKCIGKMEDVGRSGHTVLFVSHNMPAVTRLCKRGLLLEGGYLVKSGSASEVAAAYMVSETGTSAAREWLDPNTAPQSEYVRLLSVRVVDERGSVCESFDIRRPVHLKLEYEVLREGKALMPLHHLYNEEGTMICSLHDLDPQWRRQSRARGRYVTTAVIPGNLLSEGVVFVSTGFNTLDPLITQVYEREAVSFQVVDSIEPDTARGEYTGTMSGVVRPALEWSTEFTPGVV